MRLAAAGAALGLTLTLAGCNVQGSDSKLDSQFRPGVPQQDVPTAPVATDLVLTTPKNTVAINQLSATQPNAGDVLTFSIVNSSVHGVAVLTDPATGAFTYSPANNYVGGDTFTFKVSNGKDDSNTATVRITVADTIAPLISNILNTSTNEDVAKTVAFTITDADSTLTCSQANLSLSSSVPAVVASSAVVWAGTAPNCTATITPVANAFGASTLTVQLTDGEYTVADSFVLTVNQLGDDTLTGNVYGFDTGDHSHYDFADGNGSSSTILGTILQFASNLVRLVVADQTDNSVHGFGALEGGVYTGAQYDSGTAQVRLTGGDDFYSPDAIPNLKLWLKADAITGKSDGDSVANWPDSSGFSHNASQATGGLQPVYKTNVINGKPALRFDGADDRMSTGVTLSAMPYSVIIVYSYRSTASVFRRAVQGSNNWLLGPYSGSYAYYAGNTGGFFTNSASTSANQFVVEEVVGQAGTAAHYTNGVLRLSAASGSPGTLGLGAEGAYAEPLDGDIAEVIAYDAALSDHDRSWVECYLALKYSIGLGRACHNGSFVSRTVDAFSMGQNWSQLTWTPTLPFGKPLPDAGASESKAIGGYPALFSADLMNGIKGLWHLDEAATATSVGDQSGQGNDGTLTGAVQFGSAGKFKTAASFDGSNHINALMNNTPTGAAARTVSVWFKPGDAANRAILAYGSESPGALWEMMVYGHNLILHAYGGGFDTIGVSAPVVANEWQHGVIAYDGAKVKIYLNGKYRGYTSMALNTGSTYFRIGGPGYFAGFVGAIDEAAVWSRELDAAEILQLYRRGIEHLSYQVRTCVDSACAYKDTLHNAATWIGPDGTNQSYFSELNNLDTYTLGATTSTGATGLGIPNFDLNKFGSSLTSSLSANRYFQYRAIFESDDTCDATTPGSCQCSYNGVEAPCSPELSGVSVGPDHYSKDHPYVVGAVGVEFYNLSAVAQTLDATRGCGGGVKYQLSTDKSNWKWWNSSAWVATTDTTGTEANTTTQLNTAGVVSTFGSSVARGTVYFRAFLGSDGTQPCELDSVSLSGAK